LAQQLFDAHSSATHAETLAMALAESGDYERAAQLQTQLLAEARKQNNAALTRRLETHLQLFQQGRPARLSSLEG
jgi:thioredoxin-like negative regulator of GroEL